MPRLFRVVGAALLVASTLEASAGRALLEAVRGLEDPRQVESIASELVDLGAPLAEPAARAFVCGRIDVGADGAVLDAADTLLVEALLERLSWSEVAAAVRVALPRTLPAEQARTLVRLVGRRGGAEDVALLLALAGAVDERASDGPLGAGLTAATADLVRRDAGALGALETRWSRLPTSLRPMLVRGLAESDRPEAITLVTAILDWDSALSEPALTAIAALARCAPDAITVVAAARVVPLLGDGSPGVRAAAAFALGMLGEPSTAVELVDSLADLDSAVRRNAHDALCALTGVSLAPDAEAWRAWVRLERRWYGRHAGELVERVGSRRLSESLSAIEELGMHALFATELAPALASCLVDRRGIVRERICRVLGAFGRDEAIPDLERRLDDPSPEVRAAATAAIAAIRPDSV